MRISKQTIFEILDKMEVEYTRSSNVNRKSFEIASLYNPVDNGFYFFNGDCIPIKTEESLFILNEKSAALRNSNEYILVEENDCQEIYYQILNTLFKRKSNGEISKNSIIGKKPKIGKNVQIDAFSVIEDNVEIGDNVIIGSHCKIHKNSKIGNDTIIESSSIIGAQGVAWTWNLDQSERIVQPQLGGVVIGKNSFLGANTIIVRGSLNENTIIGNNTLMAPGCRIGHGTLIGDYIHFANNVTTGGNTTIGNFSFIGSGAILRPKVKLHDKTIVGAGALVVKNTTKENLTLMGVPAKENMTKKNPSGMPKPKN